VRALFVGNRDRILEEYDSRPLAYVRTTMTPHPSHPTPHRLIPTGPASFAEGSGLSPQQWWEVVAPPAELASKVHALIPASGVLEVEQLERLAGDIAADAAIWEPLVIVDENRRRYRLLYDDDRLDVWVLSWMPDQGTGFHDHDLSGVGLSCAQGEVCEKQMLLPAGTSDVAMTAGVTRNGLPGYIHSVAHAAGTPAVTIHAYSPPLVRVGQYRVDENGVMHRSIAHGRQELLDHSIAAVDPARA